MTRFFQIAIHPITQPLLETWLIHCWANLKTPVKVVAQGFKNQVYTNTRKPRVLLKHPKVQEKTYTFSCEFGKISKNTFFYRTPLGDCFCFFFIKFCLNIIRVEVNTKPIYADGEKRGYLFI